MQQELERLQTLIGRLLVIGVTMAGVIVAIGGALYLIRHGGAQVHYRVFTGELGDLTTIGGVIDDALHGSGRAIIQLGILVLVAVQLMRVALTVLFFRATRDNAFVFISVAVLAVLAYSLFGQG